MSRLWGSGKYADAIPKAEETLILREAVLGAMHPEVAECLRLLGVLLMKQQELARAEPLLERALAIREAVLGTHHPDVAQALNTLANLYFHQGLYARAEPLYQRALAIREAALGEQHPDVGQSLHNLALLYANQGLYARARPLYERALAIQEAALCEHHPDVTQSLNNLANLYSEQGQYTRAESLYERALTVREAALGEHHPDVAQSLNNLAALYSDQGLYARAESLYERALSIREAAFGKHHPGVAQSLHNLANLYTRQAMYGLAELLYERALAIREATLGEHHPSVAQSLNNLAFLYSNQGLYARAEPLHERALTIWEAVLGKHHPKVAEGLNNLATLYSNQGLYTRAEPLYERALAIREAVLGKHHPKVAEGLNNLAQVYLAQERLDTAVPLLTRAFTISEQRLRQEALDFSESRLTGFLRLLQTDEERIYALLRAHPEDASVRRLALTTVLLRKGRSAEEIASTSRTIYRSLGAQDHEAFRRLRGLRTQLAQLSLNGPGSLSAADYQRRLKALAEQGDALETDLARRSAPLRALTTLPAPSEIVDRVAATLPPDGALVEFITYADRPLRPEPGVPPSERSSQLHSLALVLLPDASTRLLDLGPAAPIDLAASGLRDALAHRDADYQRPAQALYTLAFQPLLPLLVNVRRLFLAPDGQLSLIPFDALHDGQHFLVDTFGFTYLTSGKDLLPRDPGLRPAHSVVVLSDPDFRALPATPSELQADTSEARRSPALTRFLSTSWTPLPGTRREARAIQRLLPQAQLFLGSRATKQQLLQLTTPGVLHIATHGFFLEDASAPRSSRALGQVEGLGGNGSTPLPTDPLLRSGLVLSGVHAAPVPGSSNPVSARAGSSLITALELASLDLWGTQLVVLSACDTGRGDVKLGQGVYGLRRAFVIAGAETVVMSLWKVNDDSTQVLMEDYYRRLLAGKGRAQALRDAMRTLRETRPHPYHWAPFITLGRDGPLQSIAPIPQEQPTPAPHR